MSSWKQPIEGQTCPTIAAGELEVSAATVLLLLLVLGSCAGPAGVAPPARAYRDGGPAPILQETPASGQAGGESADAMAAKLSNPTAAVASLNNNFDYRTYDGDLPDSNDQDSFTWGFQPTIPYPLEHGNVIFRPLFPILVKQPVFDVGSGEFDDEDWNLGNVSYDLVYGTTEPNGFMWFLGMVGAFPTASDDDLGADAWSAGPEAFAGIKKDWGLVGVLAGQQWDYAGDDDVSLTTGQYFYALKLPQLGPGWQLASGPTWSYDHEADSDDALTLPVGIGLAKTTKLGGRFWKFQLQYWNYVESPDTYGPDWQIRFSIAPVLAVPWGK